MYVYTRVYIYIYLFIYLFMDFKVYRAYKNCVDLDTLNFWKPPIENLQEKMLLWKLGFLRSTTLARLQSRRPQAC